MENVPSADIFQINLSSLLLILLSRPEDEALPGWRCLGKAGMQIRDAVSDSACLKGFRL